MVSRTRTCANCSSSDLVTVTLTLSEEQVAFDHCRRCEHKTWHANGVPVGLDHVLQRASR